MLNEQADFAWSAIRQSPLASVYLMEMHELAGDVLEGIDAALGLVPERRDHGGYITVNHEIHRHLLRALGAAARMRALCIERGHGPKQTALEHKIQRRRASWIADVLSGIDLDPISEAQVRHTIEHFDEYVDPAALEAYDGSIPMPALVPIDMVLSTRHLLRQFAVGRAEPTTYWVRVFIADENCFINCGHELRIGELRATAAAISDRLRDSLGPQVDEEGSSMLVLTDRTFSKTTHDGN